MDLASWCDGEWSCKWSRGMLSKKREAVTGDWLREVSGFPEWKRQGKSRQREPVPGEMMAAEPLLLQGRNLSHLINLLQNDP